MSALDTQVGMTTNKYQRVVNGAVIDVYDVLKAWEVTNPATQHAIKKLLQPGKRGHKDALQDLREAAQSIERAIELEQGEQNTLANSKNENTFAPRAHDQEINRAQLEYSKQAKRILDAVGTATPSINDADKAGDWIIWEGGENPVPSQNVEVRTISGQTFTANSDTFWWHVYGLHFDIIAYRVIGESKEEIAKPVEQDGEWTTWKGGQNPSPNKIVQYRIRDGALFQNTSDHIDWNHHAGYPERGADIIAYRVIGDAK